MDKKDKALVAHFGSASEPFMHKLYSIISPIAGGTARVRSNRRKDFWVLSYHTKPAVALAKWLYYDSDLVYLERKYTIVKPFL